METNPLIYRTNKWDGFYTIAALDWSKLILTPTFFIYYFLLSWTNFFPFPRISKLTRFIFHKNIATKMQTENLPFNSHKQNVILNTNQFTLRYFNFEPSFKQRWYRAQVLFRSQISVTIGGFELRIFWRKSRYLTH